MFDNFRTVLAKFIVQHLSRPRSLLIAAWFRLAPEIEDIKGKRRCLWAIPDLDPDNTRALLGLLALVLEEAND